MHSQSVKLVFFCLVAVLVAGVNPTPRPANPRFAPKTTSPPNSVRGEKVESTDPMLSYVVQIKNGGKFACSGVLVKTHFVLTDAMCIKDLTIGNMKVIAFDKENLKPIQKKTDGTYFGVIKVEKTVTKHDLELQNTINFSKRQDITVYGWSLTTDLPNMSAQAKNLLKLVKGTFKTEDCDMSNMDKNLFCTGIPSKVATGCGDIGSPAFIGKQLVGISRGLGSQSKGQREVYMNVGKFSTGIQNMIAYLG